jgi:PhnB protein
MSVQPVPKGFTAVTPYLMVPDVDAEIAFLKSAFGANSSFGMPGPDGKTMHGEVDIRGAKMMIGRSSSMNPPLPAMLFIYGPDVDAVFAKAVVAGGETQMDVIDQPWGDRAGAVKSPGGITYWIGMHQHDYTPDQIRANIEAHMKKTMANKPANA